MTLRLTTVLIASLSLRVLSLAAQAPTPAPTDSARLQGTWTMVSGAADGTPMPAEYLAVMKRVATGGETTVTMNGQLYFQAHFVLNPAATPKTIDYHMTGGPTTGSTQLGIYSISADTVRFIFAAPNAPRPKDFTSAPGDGKTLSVWVRAKG